MSFDTTKKNPLQPHIDNQMHEQNILHMAQNAAKEEARNDPLFKEFGDAALAYHNVPRFLNAILNLFIEMNSRLKVLEAALESPKKKKVKALKEEDEQGEATSIDGD